jgi:hypothetical protein
LSASVCTGRQDAGPTWSIIDPRVETATTGAAIGRAKMKSCPHPGRMCPCDTPSAAIVVAGHPGPAGRPPAGWSGPSEMKTILAEALSCQVTFTPRLAPPGRRVTVLRGSRRKGVRMSCREAALRVPSAQLILTPCVRQPGAVTARPLPGRLYPTIRR